MRDTEPCGCLTLTTVFLLHPSFQIIANHHMQSISFASGGDPVSWGTGERWVGNERLGVRKVLGYRMGVVAPAFNPNSL